jgi:hypothetical protein
MVLALYPTRAYYVIDNTRAARAFAYSLGKDRLSLSKTEIAASIASVERLARDTMVTSATSRNALEKLADALKEVTRVDVVCQACYALEQRNVPAKAIFTRGETIRALCHDCASISGWSNA